MDNVTAAPPPLVQIRNLSKAFPGVQALDNVQLRARPGEVHALMGENGAGKSTLMKMLAGVYPRDAGEILLDGRAVEIPSPRAAQALGIRHHPPGTQPDDPPHRGAEHLHRPRTARGVGVFLDDDALNAQAAAASSTRMRLKLDPRTQVGELTVAKQQMVEIAKALSFDSRVLIMDEPTAALNDAEIDELFRIIRQLREPRRRHRLHLAPDGRTEADLRPRHRDARRPLHRHGADRTTPHRDDHLA